MFKNYGELPSDLDDQDVTIAPPPAWFRPSGLMFPNYFPFFNGFRGYKAGLSGYGDRESEVEVNPVEILQNLKFKQEMPKAIPAIASRYTTIDPLSPLFRSGHGTDGHAKYGFGELAMPKSMLGIAAIAALIWFLFLKG